MIDGETDRRARSDILLIRYLLEKRSDGHGPVEGDMIEHIQQCDDPFIGTKCVREENDDQASVFASQQHPFSKSLDCLRDERSHEVVDHVIDDKQQGDLLYRESEFFFWGQYT